MSSYDAAFTLTCLSNTAPPLPCLSYPSCDAAHQHHVSCCPWMDSPHTISSMSGAIPTSSEHSLHPSSFPPSTCCQHPSHVPTSLLCRVPTSSGGNLQDLSELFHKSYDLPNFSIPVLPSYELMDLPASCTSRPMTYIMTSI
ncbi:hypothetical protein NDA11_001785 [Ustilago hordei]|uniref:Uncharacterized protein n=1 Tax=Ustilago hordei TaxID=120017 RepID=I2FND7_USTHO|nr:uncharacterized protein UHO2_07050 [Ustilago hordei]KAJ1572341.1 hypothetical protein NDA11_001785 [Ustilago hordei]KAJ1591468.1 hypothetical protein NDA15_007323 [Ustilago hordei]KAJ1593657.1 hypothetical protein NDA12_003776 [Ustilago hordei]KAJ1604057.1 hypothetical protein NDA14_006825 [Ustilago hordei]UTT88467.1 hypothetical protein NDA17_003392 [Ustilago hordei]